jgi:hypothetical protein
MTDGRSSETLAAQALGTTSLPAVTVVTRLPGGRNRA